MGKRNAYVGPPPSSCKPRPYTPWLFARMPSWQSVPTYILARTHMRFIVGGQWTGKGNARDQFGLPASTQSGK